ncbi:cob(I)yrinic acid a,c-diamide adenosyltransferase [Hyphobacterium sp. SN044]|uniref:cob(I)yrinic acid a,c-diamide adenosyltransferase n=1 Tax=Hyphobacterium sp. SN044 TaxID=2912575 RepID=UPI001EFFC226|nr:cob(I)yrinic acid a,c-diamide adenosyltransferase [Hyphobacterium sp. SN044]MCF8879770.1 cob(I)yrinic acid a,c-diamide adenosyltransferase [Hyphobacterium sp. SN044]
MVRLTKIYTRTGDGGKTRLGDMSETSKTDARVEAYGTVDEANSAIGLARAALPVGSAIDAVLMRVQNDLFDVGADLCVPDRGEKLEWEPLRATADQVSALEADIDRFNAKLDPLDSFILPGGTEAAARLHVARTVMRRAERRTVALAEAGEPVNAEAIKYLNRASDLLFVLARIANDEGRADVKWVPGGQR